MFQRFLHFIYSLENTPQTLLSYGGAFLSLIILRLTIEFSLGSFSQKPFAFIFFEFTHTFLFFLFSLLLFICLFQFLTKESFARVSNVVLFGFLIITTPPIIDTLIFKGQLFWSFYEFDGLSGLLQRYFTLFGDTPQIGITYGVRIEVILVTLATALYTYLKTKSRLQSLLALFLAYTTLFILGTFPSWLTLIIEAPFTHIFTVSDAHVAKIFLTPEKILSHDIADIRSVLNIKMSLFYAFFVTSTLSLLFWKKQKKHFLALYHNARFPQLFFHGGLLMLGSLLAWYFEKLSLSLSLFSFLAYVLLIISVQFSWLCSVIINDLSDTSIDALTNKNRPLIKKVISKEIYLIYALFFFFFALLFAGLVNTSALLLVFSYQVIAYMYSAPPLRLKRIPFVATLLAAFTNLIVIAIGYLAFSENGSLGDLPVSFILYLLVALMFSLSLKDFKDIEGDSHDNVFTLPVILGAEKAKLFVGSILFIIFALSPLLLKETSLLPLSLLFASLAFFMVQKGTNDQKSLFYYHRFSLVFFTLAFCYGVSLVLALAFNL